MSGSGNRCIGNLLQTDVGKWGLFSTTTRRQKPQDQASFFLNTPTATASCVAPFAHGCRLHVRMCATTEVYAREGAGALPLQQLGRRGASTCPSQAYLGPVQQQNAPHITNINHFRMLVQKERRDPLLTLWWRRHFEGGVLRARWRQV